MAGWELRTPDLWVTRGSLGGLPCRVLAGSAVFLLHLPAPLQPGEVWLVGPVPLGTHVWLAHQEGLLCGMLWTLGALGGPPGAVALPGSQGPALRRFLARVSLRGRQAGPDSHKFEVNWDLARNSEVGGMMPVVVPLDAHP